MLLAILFGLSITVQAQIVTEQEDEMDEEPSLGHSLVWTPIFL